MLAIPYKFNSEFNNNPDVTEYNIVFFKSRNRLEDLIGFAAEYPDKQINIEFAEGIQISVMKALNKINENCRVRLKSSDFNMIEELKKDSIKYFFDYSFCPNNFTTLQDFINMGVSDMYISDDLCYSLPDVSDILKNHGIKLRVVLNKIPSSSLMKGTNPKSIVYRPQDIDYLQQYYDIFEFDCYKDEYVYDWHVFNVFYRSWFQRKHWHGDLAEINDDLQIHINNDTLIPDMTERKSVCGMRCNKRAVSHCRKCEQFLETSDILMSKNAMFRLQK